VPTPVKDRYQPDLSILINAVKSVAKNLQHRKDGTLVIIESTINPGVCDEIVIPLLASESGLKVNEGFFVAHCPERINPGDKQWNVANIPRVVGGSNEHSLQQTVAFYKSIIDAAVEPMASLKEAEAVKIVENSFRDVNIAFVNELAMSFTKLDINIMNVIRGASTKPFAFMAHYPSVGVGGHCIPVDPYYLIEYARDFGFEHEFLKLARNINNNMPRFTVDRLMDGLNEAGMALKNSKVVVLGLSYKANVADDRESPAYVLIDILKSKGATVTTFDPYVPAKSSAKSLEAALHEQDAIVLTTNHAAFADILTKPLENIKVLVDGKNMLTRTAVEAAGIIYRGIGT
jgi:nucleotide sugar dehydrogenase